MSISKREKILIAVAAVFIEFAVLKYGYLNFRKKVVVLEASIATAKGELATQQAKLTELAQKRAPTSVGIGEAVIQQYIEENSNLTAFIRRLTDSEEFADIEVLRLSVEGTEVVGGSRRVHYKFSVRAPYLSIGRLIEQFENSSTMVDVKSLDVARDGEDLQQVIGKMDLHHYVMVKE